jgi:hypothetical protein
MLTAAVMTLSLLGGWPHLFGHNAHEHQDKVRPAAAGRTVRRAFKAGAWHGVAVKDGFSGAVSCALAGRGVSLHSQTLIFDLGHGLETTHAQFKVDGGPARSVAEAFPDVRSQGFFPERGWILDAAGGQVALPLSYVDSAATITIRAAAHGRPKVFRLAHLGDAVAKAGQAGCTDASFR